MKKVKSILIVLLIGLTTAVAVVSLLLTLFLPTLLRRLGCAPYGVRCAVGQAKLQLHLNLTSYLVIQDLTVFEQDGPGVVLHAKRLAVALHLPTMIRTPRAMVTELRIDNPELLLRRLEDGRWNLLALAQEVRQHLRPTTRVTPVQLPRISLNAGAFHIGARRLTDVSLTLEPKPAPSLFEVQVQAAVEGKPMQVTGVVDESLKGELQAQAKEILLDGATRAWKPHAAVRFHLDLVARTLDIPEWAIEDDGTMARGAAAIRYAEWPLTYELTVAAWRANLGALAERFPLPWLSVVTGNVQGEPFAIKAQWPQLPVANVTVTLTGIGFQLPKQRFLLAGVRGICRLHYKGARARLQADIRGEAVELSGQRYANPAFSTVLSADPRNGDVSAEELGVSIPGLRIRAKGGGRQWGRDGLDVTTTELTVNPGILNRVIGQAPAGLVIRAVQGPSIHIRWPGGGRPWNVAIASRYLQLSSPTSGYEATLKETDMVIEGVGVSWRDLHGTIASREADVAGRQLSVPMARFEIHPDRIQISELRVAVANGKVHGHASFSRPSVLRDLRAELSVQGLRVEQLFPAIEKPTHPTGFSLNAEVSAAISDGRMSATIDLPPAATGQLFRLIHQPRETAAAKAPDGHLILRAQGTLQNTKGLQASGSVTTQGLHALLAGAGRAGPESPLALSFAYREGLLTLKAKELGLAAHELTALLSGQVGGRILAGQGSVVISAEATFGRSQPPSGTGEIMIRGLSLDLARKEAALIPLLRGLKGSVAFTLDKELLAIHETALRADGGLNLTVKGSVPLGGNGGRSATLRLTLPWTDASSLLSPLAALAPERLAWSRLTGQIRSDLDISGHEYHGTVVLRSINMESDLLRLDGVSGMIPLTGQFGRASAPDRASGPEWIGWPGLSEGVYDATLERWRKTSSRDQAPYWLTIASLRYGTIELRDFEASLAPSGDQIAIQRFAFQAWGGMVGGWGAVQPLSGRVSLALLTDGVSLRAICDAFPPIKGYISGRINGLADLSIPSFAFDKAQGKARFWAVSSPQERREISRTLIEKLAGQRIRYFSLFGQDRRYDRGILDVGLKQGNLIFHELNISHTTLGIKDLDIKVSPTFNKIGLGHLLESVKTAIERVKAKAKPQP